MRLKANLLHKVRRRLAFVVFEQLLATRDQVGRERRMVTIASYP